MKHAHGLPYFRYLAQSMCKVMALLPLAACPSHPAAEGSTPLLPVGVGHKPTMIVTLQIHSGIRKSTSTIKAAGLRHTLSARRHWGAKNSFMWSSNAPLSGCTARSPLVLEWGWGFGTTAEHNATGQDKQRHGTHTVTNCMEEKFV